ncbi:unnamed protein product [Symbiodinium microadriaticum]|nr:unnamed protein product [Symbiodinium microadriaticum]
MSHAAIIGLHRSTWTLKRPSLHQMQALYWNNTNFAKLHLCYTSLHSTCTVGAHIWHSGTIRSSVTCHTHCEGQNTPLPAAVGASETFASIETARAARHARG